MIGNKAILRRLTTLVLVSGFAPSILANGPGATTLPKEGPSFIENKGQWDSRARFYSGLPGMDVWVTEGGFVYKAYRDTFMSEAEGAARIDGVLAKPFKREAHVFGMSFEGSSPSATYRGVQARDGIYNYIRNYGAVNNVHRYDEAAISGLYPGIDARVYLEADGPRYDLIVQPGADPSVIQTTFKGTEKVRVVNGTTLAVTTRFGEVNIGGLFAYQEINGQKKQIKASFKRSGKAFRFNLGNYDQSKPLIIDPLIYSTLLGAGGGDDQATSVVVDSQGFTYVTGATFTPVFPVTFGAFNEFIQGLDAFVTKMRTDVSGIVWSTFVGGEVDEYATAIARDVNGNLYITGPTNSTQFPVSLLAAQPANAGTTQPTDGFYPNGTDGFVFKLSPDGSTMQYGTYLGGIEAPWKWHRPAGPNDPDQNIINPASSEVPWDIAVNSLGEAVVVGFTRSTGFPVTANAVQPVFGGSQSVPPFLAPPYGADAGRDGFITKVNSAGTAFLMSTYMGGRAQDVCTGVAVDSQDNIYISGTTNSTGTPATQGVFVTTPNALDRTINNRDTFVLKMPPDGASRTYCTAIGGSGNDGNYIEGDDGFSIGWYDQLKPEAVGRGFFGAVKIAINADGDMYIMGNTSSVDFPTTVAAYDRTYNNGTDLFLTKVFRDGTRLDFSTLTGQQGANFPNDIIVDSFGTSYIVGISPLGGLTIPAAPNNFSDVFEGPDTLPFDWFFGDGFVLAFDGSGSNLTWGTYIGGEEGDEIFGAAVDVSNNLYICGRTNSWTQGNKVVFPTTPDVFRPFMINDRPPPNAPPKAWSDAFLTKVNIRVPVVMSQMDFAPPVQAGTLQVTATITLNGPAPVGGTTILLTNTRPDVATMPDSVFVAEGATNVSWTIDTAAVDENVAVSVTATAEQSTLTKGFDVVPYLASLSVSNLNVVGGNSITGRVTLFTNPPPGGAEVIIESGDPDIVIVPDTVTVPDGQVSATFQIDTTAVGAAVAVPITARYLGTGRTQVINVLPAGVQQMLFIPSRVTGGEIGRARVILNGTVPVNTNLAITRISGAANVSFPAVVTVPAGQNSIEFDVQTGFVTSSTFVRLRATGPGGFTEGSLGIEATQLKSVVLTPTSLIGGGVISGRVNLTRATAASGLRITLTNSNPAAGTLDKTTVVVPPGSTISEPFTIQTFSVTQTQQLTITASKPGYSSKSATATVLEPTLGMNLIISPASVTGGSPVTGILSIAAAVPDDLVFTISSNNAAAIVPATVTIPAGETEVQFNIDTVLVASDRNVTITARRGTQSATAQLQVLSPNVSSLTLTPTTVRPNQTSTAFLQLDWVAPAGGIKVNISASIPSLVVIPTSVTVPAGRSTATFTVRANAVSRPIAVEIICQIQGKTRRVSAFLFINP